MANYRLYCLDGAGKITSANWIAAETDDEALGIARAHNHSVTYELWQSTRLVTPLPHSQVTGEWVANVSCPRVRR